MRMTLVLQIAMYFLLFYGLCVIFMYLRQGSFLFFPTSARHIEHVYKQVENYELGHEAGMLRGWLVNPGLVKEKLIIYYGGNAEDIFQNIDEFSDIKAASLFVSYRGYGASDGKPGEAELFADALAVIDDIIAKYSPEKIFLVGRSLGSGVACYTAAMREVQGIILITPYDSIVNVARQAYPWLPVSLLLKHRFVSTDYLDKILCPIQIIYGGQDRVVSPERTENLIRHIVREKEIEFIERADHGTIDMFPDYLEAFLRFINREEVDAE